MTHPDARQDPLAALNYIMDHLDEAIQGKQDRRISGNQAAKELGYGQGYFHGKPWRVPGFGLHGTMHTLAEWRAWDDRPEVERRNEWDAIPFPQRAKCRGVA